MTRDDLLALDGAGLARVMAEGHAIPGDALVDVEYRGISLGMPAWVDRVAWKTFKKVFHRDATTGALRGWNVRMKQDGVDGAWEPVQMNGAPKTFGHYRVVGMQGYRPPRPCAHATMLDYSDAGNPRLDPVGRVRDPVVAVNPGSADLLLGWTYLRVGGLRVSTPSYFALVRDIPLSHRAAPPRAA